MPNTSIVGMGSGYDNAEYALNIARVEAADTIEGLSGEVLTDDWPSTWVMLNIAYRKCQHVLANNGVETNLDEILIGGLVPVQGSDPAIQVILGNQGYFNGVNWVNPPALPPDMIMPLRLWERPDGTQSAWCQVTPCHDGLPGSLTQLQQFLFWDWRGDSIFLPGATQQNELRLRFQKYYPELANPNDVIPFKRITLALGFMTAAEFVGMSDGEKAVGLYAKAQDELDDIVAQTVRKKQRRGVQKRAYGGQGSRPGHMF